jgi:general stress protein YciG
LDRSFVKWAGASCQEYGIGILSIGRGYYKRNNTDFMAQNNRSEGGGRGFAGMDPDKQREIASKGGRSQGASNNPGNFANDPEKAREAGRKGGLNRGTNEITNDTQDYTDYI